MELPAELRRWFRPKRQPHSEAGWQKIALSGYCGYKKGLCLFFFFFKSVCLSLKF